MAGLPSSRQRYESEALLKVLFAENGTKDDLLATIRAIREDALAVREHFLQFADVYEAGDGQSPERFDLSALAARLLCEQQAVPHAGRAGPRRSCLAGTAVRRGCRLGIQTLRASGEGFAIAEDPVSPQT